jgi:ribonuclease P protein component
VERNRVKRRLTELVRRELLARLGSTDVLIRARPEAYKATFDELREDVQAIRQRLPAQSAE